jgi:hypothetical protein
MQSVHLASLRPSLMEAKGVAGCKGASVTVSLKEAALPRQGAAKVRGDAQESSEARTSRTSLQHKAKSSIHYKLCSYTRHSRTERDVFTPGGLPCAL